MQNVFLNVNYMKNEPNQAKIERRSWALNFLLDKGFNAVLESNVMTVLWIYIFSHKCTRRETSSIIWPPELEC